MIYSKDDVKRMLDWLDAEVQLKASHLSWGWPKMITLGDFQKILKELETKI